MIKIHGYSPAELEQFRHYQSLSYDILEATAQSLQVGMSEHQVTHALRKAFHEAGAHNYFHVPVALFGERSSYPGDFGAFEALSTDRLRRLTPNWNHTSACKDVAPYGLWAVEPLQQTSA